MTPFEGWAVLAWALLALPLTATTFRIGQRAVRAILEGLRHPAPDWTPPTTVILPCKGWDPDLESNLRSLLQQDHPAYELLVSVASEDDPAVEIIRRVLAGLPEDRARLIIAGRVAGCAEKLNNQRAALQAACARSEAFVFVDSDMRARPDFLRRLVAPLKAAGVGASSGFRWFLPQRGGLGSILRMIWIGGGLISQLDPRVGYAWGGAMAMHRSTFKRLGMLERWTRGLSDDMLLSGAVRDAGLRIAFVPQCGVAAREDSTLAQTIEFTNRQVTISRVYHPAMWQLCTLAHGLILALPLATLSLAVSCDCGAWVLGALALLALLPVFANLFVAGRLLPAVALALGPGTGAEALAYQRTVTVLAPVAMLLLCLNVARSLWSRTITWRGVRYRLVSPGETIVIHRQRPNRSPTAVQGPKLLQPNRRA